MNEKYRLFSIKNTTFYGTEKDLEEYNQDIGNATESENNLRRIIASFEENSIEKI